MTIINTKPMKHTYIYLTSLILLLFIFCPFNLEIAPKRLLRVIGSNGITLQDAIVRQTYFQYSLGQRDEFDLTVDKKGEVVIPQRKVRTNIFSLLLGALTQIKNAGIHANFGSDEIIMVFAANYSTKSFYEGRGLDSGTIILERN
jgi:hypothetical protein